MSYLTNRGYVSSGNSTSTLLNAGATFTGAWEDVSKYNSMSIAVNTAVETVHELIPSQPFIIGEKSVFWVEATTDTNNTVCTGRFSCIEVRDIDA